MTDEVQQMDDGGFAYPSTPDADACGMSLRDWFAGQALAGMLSNDGGDDGYWQPNAAAERSYKMADALIAARKAGA